MKTIFLISSLLVFNLQKEIMRNQRIIAMQKNELIKLYNPIVRLQLIAGINNPDTNFVYLSKIQNLVNIKSLQKKDLR